MAEVRHEVRDEVQHGSSREERSPDAPRRRPATTVMLRRTVAEFQEDNLTDWAAALTYYGLLALFPALIAMVGIVGYVADPGPTTRTLTDIVSAVGPPSAAQTFAGPIQTITTDHGTSGVMGIVGILAALWSASGYVGAFTRASNIVYETPEGRPFWKLRPLQLAITLVMIVLLVAVAFSLVLTGPVVDAVAAPLGVGGTAVSIWNIAKWPAVLVVMVGIFSVLFYATPNARLRGWRWVLPGAGFAIAVWIVASVAFAFYAAHFGSYNKTYGTLGGVVAFLVWVWITNVALLLGMELNAERERSEEISAGVPHAEEELQLPVREAPDEPTTRYGGRP